MAGPLRIEQAGGWYHVTARGNERRAIFRDDGDRVHSCQLLAQTAEQFPVSIHAYVLMDNHYHMLLELREASLSRAVQWLNLSYSSWFNRRHDRSVHLFQGRFKSVIFSPREWGLELSRYVHLNPVRVARLGLGKGERRRQRLGVGDAPGAEQVGGQIAPGDDPNHRADRPEVGTGNLEYLERKSSKSKRRKRINRIVQIYGLTPFTTQTV